MQAIAATIRRLRVERGFTQAQIAYLVGVSEKTVRRWESEPGDVPRPKVRDKLARVLGVSVDELGYGEGG